MNSTDYMKRALKLAVRGNTSPNPMVGAVVVRGDEIVGEGYHPRAGEPHAEVFALRAAGPRAKGADLYVTLEPCCHQGRTPPCTRAVIDAGIARVFVAMTDPDPRVSCRGIDVLKGAGIAVECGLCEDEARKLNEAYIKHRTTGTPLVILKSAMSLDGKIATRTGDSRWITGDSARRYVHRIRSRVDAIVVGAGTARADDPALTARLGKKVSYPRRVVVSSGRLPDDLKIFREPGETVIAVPRNADKSCISKLQDAGARILTLDAPGGQPSIAELMHRLGEMGCLSVLIEGGGRLAASALEERVVDRVIYFYAPRIIGGSDAVSAVAGIGASKVADSISLDDVKLRRFDRDLAIEGRVVYPVK